MKIHIVLVTLVVDIVTESDIKEKIRVEQTFNTISLNNY